MCGIAGLLDLSGAPVEAGLAAAMSDLLRHRGPDDDGLWADGVVALAHRRLSIIDLSPRGRNPMANEDGSVRLVYNGEVYNYRELRDRLRGLGHEFASDADSEVLVHLYEERGPDLVDELNGIFAFALWDAARRCLLLARDRCGVKPLYYTTVGRILAFASEPKAFLALPSFRARVDVRALSEFLTFQNAFEDRTLFEGVHLLPAGYVLVAEHGNVHTRRYWHLQFEPIDGRSEESWADELRQRFVGAVVRQLVSDVPVGSFLSGGMDTGSISAVAARHIAGMHTFTCGFELPTEATEQEQYFDERGDARALADHLGTVHHELTLGPDAMAEVLPAVVWHLDEPRVGISYQVFHTARVIGQHVKVVLSGVGGDELFAGYPWRYERIAELDDDATFTSAYYREWVRLLSEDDKRSLFTPDAARALGDFSTVESFRRVLGPAGGDDPLHRALRFDFNTFLQGLLLVDDKLGMANAVEGRVPFLDNEIVDCARRIPSHFKARDGQGKLVLRRAMTGLLPGDTLIRRKQGFTPPDETWYRRDSLRTVHDLVLGPRARARGYFEPAAVAQLLDEHVSGRRNRRFLLWFLMCFEWWNRLFVDRDPVEFPAAGRLYAGSSVR